jgi:hypothetical protein
MGLKPSQVMTARLPIYKQKKSGKPGTGFARFFYKYQETDLNIGMF